MEIINNRSGFIRYILLDRPELIPILDSNTSILKKLETFDSNLFIVWNTKRQWYEVHSIKSFNPRVKNWTTHQLDWYVELDDRLLEHLFKNSIKHRGKELFDFLERENDLMFKERDLKNSRKIERSLNEVKRTIRGYNTNY